MSDSQQLLRQWTLLRLLSARRQGATLRELADETGVSQKTVGRDLALLRRLAFPVEEVVGEHGRKRWTMPENAAVPRLGFTFEEAASLYLGRQFLDRLAGTEFWRGARSAFRKIHAAFGEAAIKHLQKIAAGVYLTPDPTADYESRAALIEELMLSIEDRHLTVMTYHSRNATEPVTLYDVHPYALVHHRGGLYVIAWSKDHGMIRSFKVDRIISVSRYQLRFERPADFRPDRYLRHSFGIHASEAPPRTARVRFSAGVARLLEEKAFHPSQRLVPGPDGEVTAEFTLNTFEEFLSWIMSFGPEAELLDPPELRDRLRDSLRAAVERYDAPHISRVARP